MQLWTDATGPEAAPLVVLCHGGPGFWDTLHPVGRMIDDRCRVVRWDQRGAAYTLTHPARVDALVYLCGIGLEWRSGGHAAAYAEERARRLGPLAARFAELRARERSPEGDRELRVLAESTNYADRARAHALAREHLDDRWEVNGEANARINSEWFALDPTHEGRRCEALALPAIVMQGADDPRRQAACDSLVAALPRVTRAVVPGGHEPWLEYPAPFREALRSFVEGVRP